MTYDFHRLIKVKKHADRKIKCSQRIDRREQSKLREPLQICESVLVLAQQVDFTKYN